MIDLHCHLLPGIDDGAPDIETAVRMAEMAYRDGITTIVATPHLNETWRPGRSLITERIAELKERLTIPLTLLVGADIALSHLLAADDPDTVVRINNSRYLMIELPEVFDPDIVEEQVFRFQRKGFSIILSHPERIPLLMEKPELLARLVARGCLGQVTSSSVTGKFGRHIQAQARRLLEKQLVHVIGTDAHSDVHRKPILSSAFETARQWIGDAARDLVTTVPEKIINDRVVET